MRRSAALGTCTALVFWFSLVLPAASQDAFSDFPDDTGAARPTPPAPRSDPPPRTAPRTVPRSDPPPQSRSAPPGDAFEDDFAAPGPPTAPRTAPGRSADPFESDFGGAAPAPGAAPAAASVPRPAPSGASRPQPGASTAPRAALRPPAAETDLDASAYAVRLRELEQRIHALKEQIFRSKARLSLLAETVLQGVSAGAQVRIIHDNEMGQAYRLVRAIYAVDGAPIFNQQDEEGALSELDEFDVFEGSMVPGEHTLSVTLEYRGHGFGVFSYLRGYRFRVQANYVFTAPEGRAITLRVTGFEDGGPTTPLEERPAIRFIERVEATGTADPRAGRPAAPSSGRSGRE